MDWVEQSATFSRKRKLGGAAKAWLAVEAQEQETGG